MPYILCQKSYPTPAFIILALECVVSKGKSSFLRYNLGHMYCKTCLFDDPQDCGKFKKRIRQYNNAMAFTSVDVEMGNEGIQGAGPTSFHIHGALYHLMGALISSDNQQPSFAQLYIYDPVEATDRQIQHNHQLDGAILLDLHEMLREHHPHAPLYKQAYEIMRVSVFVLI